MSRRGEEWRAFCRRMTLSPYVVDDEPTWGPMVYAEAWGHVEMIRAALRWARERSPEKWFKAQDDCLTVCHQAWFAYQCLAGRCLPWREFQELVAAHIRDYTVPQYGDEGEDQVTGWSAGQCLDQIERYLNRFGRGRRGEAEQLRDMVKIAHYACLAAGKFRREIDGGGE